MMKKLINKVDDVLNEQLKGFASAHNDLLKVNFEPTFAYRKDAPIKNKVALISGGGSGHEPLHNGYVGSGMLDAACPGEIFTSPTPDQMYEAAKKVDGGAGVLFIVKNYTGDVMNFEMAADMAREDGIDVRNVIIDDDVAVKDSLFTAGRRGMGVTVLAEKICGAAADAGYDLDQIEALCRKVNRHGKSMGMALTACITPANGTPSFDLDENKMEIGIGIHGEPGVERMELKSANEITQMLVSGILDDENYTRKLHEWSSDKNDWVDVKVTDEPIGNGDRVIAMVNSMGGTPISELYGVYSKMEELLEAAGIEIARSMVGHYITSLEMQGVSITLLKVDNELLKFYDAPVHTPGWHQ
ncbi:MAG: dihydroxyacetone kinase subunit DhaK [Gracilimonas sp.]|nr:dihydroxyacetone kinase subunit DhaK [Gracilimonas sp.]